MTSRLRDLLERHVASGTVPGVVASLGTGEPEIVAAGAMSVGGPPIRDDAIFRIESMTKAVTTVAALRLVEAGRLTLDEPVVRWLPELADRQVLKRPAADLADAAPSVRAITLRHLLTNTSGYGMVLTESPLQRAMVESEVDAGAGHPTFGAGRVARPSGGPAAGLPAGRGLAIPPLVRHPGDPDRAAGGPAVAGSPGRRPDRTARPPRHGILGARRPARPAAGQLPPHRVRAGGDRAGRRRLLRRAPRRST